MKPSLFFYCAILLFAFLFFQGCKDPQKDRLPILGKRESTEKNVNGKIIKDTIYHTIADFKFLDQDSIWISNQTMNGKIYVADFFFTTCPTICPIMKTQMLRVYEKYKNNKEVLLLSHSIDPEHDSVAVLREFAQKLRVESKKWHFVTGSKEKIYEIGQKSYMVSVLEDQTEPGGFIHSGAFILVDKEKRVRGVYDGTKEDDVNRLIEDIPLLLREYKK